MTQLSVGFWRSQDHDPSFGPTILEALGNESIRSAFEFLVEVEWTPAIEAAVAMLVPNWLEDAGRAEVVGAFRCVEGRLT